MFQKFKDKHKMFWDWCNGNQWILTFYLGIPTIISILSYLFFSWRVFLVILIISIIITTYSFKETILKHWKISFSVILWFCFIGWSFYSFASRTEKILELTEGFSLVFEDTFEWGNYQVKNEGYSWKDKDGHFAQKDDNLSLKTSAALHQIYPLFQDLKKINRDYILITKFYLPDSARVSTQFMNTMSMDSDEYRGFHFQECVISAYSGEGYSKWYGDYLYEYRPKDWTGWEKANIEPGNYTMLVKVSGNKFSCYFQAENEKTYTMIFNNKVLKYQNIGWPALSRNVDGSQYTPQILDFKFYLRK